MRTIVTILTMLFIVASKTFAQQIDELAATPVEICYEKTLHIVFPTEIKYLSTGNDNILAEKVSSCPNVVRIIASEENFDGETNLSVVTADTKFYTYSVRYSAKPVETYIKIGENYKEPHRIPVGSDKNMFLIFPGKIIYEDHGSTCVTVEKAEGVDNIISIKATEQYETDTNISVITENGKFYTFSLNYTPNPEITSFVVDKAEQQKVAILDEGELSTDAKQKIHDAINKRLFLNLGMDDKNSGIEFEINNIFIHRDLLLFRISLHNRTQIDYTIDFMRFYIQDAKISKKTAIQQLEQNVQFMFDYAENVPSHSKRTFVVALNKLTIPDKKRLIIEIQEKNGGRHFFYKLKNKDIMKCEEVFRNIHEQKTENEADKILRRVYNESANNMSDIFPDTFQSVRGNKKRANRVCNIPDRGPWRTL